jgi:hypothetical protein
MEPITSVTGLKNAIQILEIDHTVKKQSIRDQVNLLSENLKLSNLIRNNLQGIASSPEIINNVLGTTVGLASGYAARKIITGGSAGIARKLFGSLLQLVVTTVIAQHPETIKSIGQSIFGHFLKKRGKFEQEATAMDNNI